MSYAQPASYAVGVAQSDIPSKWMPSSEPRVQSSGSQRIVSIASQNGTVTSGQPLSFVLPSNMGAGFMVSGSAYIRCTVSVTQVQIAGNQSWAFRQYGSGHSIFQRMTAVLSGQTAETLESYNKLQSSLLLHCTNGNYISNDDKLLQNTMSAGFETGQTLTVCIPVNLGCFNAKSHLPLFLLSAAQLQCQLDSAAQAFTSGTANAITEFSVSNATLIFEQLVPPSEYEQAMRQMLASGKLYQIPINTFYNLRFANAASITQNIGLNTSSLKGVFWNVVIGNNSQNSGAFTSAAQTSAYLYLDGALVSNSNLSSEVEQFAEMNRALNVMSDITRTSWAPFSVVGLGPAGVAAPGDFTPAAITRITYSAGAYLGGLSTSRSDQAGFSFSGSPVNTAVLQVSNAGTAGVMYVYCALQQVLTIDPAGNVNLIR